jgi:hypothetical protein
VISSNLNKCFNSIAMRKVCSYDQHSTGFDISQWACGRLSAVDCRLIDVIHSDKRLHLVFEYCDLDLKKHMDQNPTVCKDRRIIKVRSIALFVPMLLISDAITRKNSLGAL